MNADRVNIYADARRYDLVAGDFATGDELAFYARQIARYGEPVLELACGTGRLTIPLAEAGIQIAGLDLSPEMLGLARAKAAARGVDVALRQGDMRRFALGATFQVIFVAAQALSHLYTRQDVEACFACVREHLADGGRFLIEVFNPSLTLLSRRPGQRYPVGEYIDPHSSRRMFVTQEVRYDAAAQVNHIQWFYRDDGSDEESVLSYEMRQFFPQEMDVLLVYNGFAIEHKWGGYDEADFASDSPKQIIVCQARR